MKMPRILSRIILLTSIRVVSEVRAKKRGQALSINSHVYIDPYLELYLKKLHSMFIVSSVWLGTWKIIVFLKVYIETGQAQLHII